MPLVTNLATVQTRVKDSIDSSSIVGLAVRANGEERTKVITHQGIAYNAGIPKPVAAPARVVVGPAGTLINNKWYGYTYCYVATTNYPLVENTFSINGRLSPRGNPGPVGTTQIPSSGSNRAIQITVATLAGRPDVDKIWIFRTRAYDTSAEALNAVTAGLAYFILEVANGAITITDDGSVPGVDQVENDNFEAPTAQFCKYYDPHWFLFGNHTFYQKVTWVAATGVITLDALAGTWFDGRDGQTFTLSGITTGGFDGAGGYKFKWLTSTTMQATVDGTTPVALTAMGGGDQFITIQGPPTTLYRSKPRNPFSWGWTRVIGTSQEALQFALKVGGGIGTAIATVPNEPILKLDTEFPAKCYGYNLQLADNFDTFKQTQRIISDVFSVTSHFSQFVATTKDGQNVLWGIDYKNFAILQSNGISQYPISGPIPKILRILTQDRQRQFLAHGLYDPQTELNCIWVTTANSPNLVDLLIYQHAPTGFWGMSDEKDLLCSANVTDPDTGLTSSFGGTETGFFGQIFAKGIYSNWLPTTGVKNGTITSATNTTITHAEATDFNIVDPGMVGNWVLIIDNLEVEGSFFTTWARISAVAAKTLTIDRVIRYANGAPWINFVDPTFSITADFNGLAPSAGYKFFVGMIECAALKYFDFGQPITDKRLLEFWINQRFVGISTHLRLYREWAPIPDVSMYFALESQSYSTGDFNLSETYHQKIIVAELMKYFGLEVVNRGYDQWEIRNMVLKPKMTP